MKKWFHLSLLPILLTAATRWRALESDNFRIVYPEGYEDQAKHAASWVETEREKINTFTGWDPGKVWLVIEDIGMGVNGFANPVGEDIHLFATPPSGFDLSTRDWMRTVGVHEYVHIASIQPVYGFPKILNILFGPWVLPNALVPGWMIEGATVYYESQVEPYEGRLEEGFFEANLLTRTSHGAFPKEWEMNGSITQFPGGSSIYAYGGPFFEWMVEDKGADKVSEFYRINGASFPAFFIDRSARKSFGDRFPYLLHDWKQVTYERASSWLSADSAARRLTDKGWYIDDITTDGQRVYYVRTSIKKRAALNSSWYVDIVAADPETGKEEVILRPNTSVQMLRVHDGVLYYTATTIKRGFPNTDHNGFGELAELRSHDLSTGKKQKLFTGRLRAFDRLPDGSFLISIDRTPKFGSALIKMSPHGEEKLWEGELLIGEIVVSDEGQVFYAAREQGENWDIYKFSPNSWERVTATVWSESGLSFDPRGNLLYSANPYGPQGKVGLYRLDKETGTIQMFDAPSYATSPFVVGEELIFASLNPQGYDLYSVEAKSSPAAFPKEPLQEKSQLAYEGEFERRSRLRPYLSLLRTWARIPYVWPTFDERWNLTNLDAGIFLLGADVLGENSYESAVSYDILTNTNQVDFHWSNQGYAPLSLNLDYSHNPMWDTLDQFLGYNYRIYPSFSYPIYYRPGRGLNVIRWGEGILVEGVSFEHRALLSNISTSLSWYHYQIGFALSHFWESPVFSSYESSWLFTRGAGVVDLARGMLIADISTNIDLSAEGFDIYGYEGPIRGYHDDTLLTIQRIFATATLEFRHRLLKMRFGIWNPNIFFEDLYVNLFTDAAFNSQNLLGASAGLELSPEIHFFWGFVRVAPIIGLSYNLEGEINFHGGVSTALPFEIFYKRKDAVQFAAEPWLDFQDKADHPVFCR